MRGANWLMLQGFIGARGVDNVMPLYDAPAAARDARARNTIGAPRRAVPVPYVGEPRGLFQPLSRKTHGRARADAPRAAPPVRLTPRLALARGRELRL